MRFEVYLSNGEIEKIDMGTSENEEETISEIEEKLIYQIENLGFVFYKKSGDLRVINAKGIDEIRIIHDEKEKENANV